METIHALIADADVLARHKIATVLEAESDITCRLASPDGADLLAILTKEPPDVLLLDLEGLPMDATELLSRIRSLAPRLPVVVLVSRTEAGADLAIDALLDGAAEFVTKPENGVNVLFADGHFRKRLVPIIRSVVRRTTGSTDRTGTVGAARPRTKAAAEAGVLRRPSVFVIGGCSGAIPVLQSIVSGLDAAGGYLLIAQHLPRYFTAALADRLSMVSARPVVEAADGALLTSDRMWLAPGGHHLGIRVSGYDRLLHVHRGRRESGCRPSIDALFRSVAETFRDRATGIILSGCSKDGVRGCRAIHDAGGRILVQDPATARVPDLPEAVISAGLASAVLTPDGLVEAVNRLTATQNPRSISDRVARIRNTANDHDRTN